MSSPVALIQGASRGIGLQFCRHLLGSSNNCSVIATCRKPENAGDLRALCEQFPKRISVLPLDVTDESNILAAADQVGNAHGKLDLLVNCSAMLHPSGRGETSLDAVNQKDQSMVFATNTIGPLLMAKYFRKLLQKGNGAFGNPSAQKTHAAVLANISARVGSISDNGLGGWYAYRMSKCALNMATKNLSIELGRGKGKVVCVVIHPGTVETDLSRPYHKGVPKDKLFFPEYSVNCMMNIITSVDFSQTGKYFAWDGTEIPY